MLEEKKKCIKSELIYPVQSSRTHIHLLLLLIKIHLALFLLSLKPMERRPPTRLLVYTLQRN